MSLGKHRLYRHGARARLLALVLCCAAIGAPAARAAPCPNPDTITGLSTLLLPTALFNLGDRAFTIMPDQERFLDIDFVLPTVDAEAFTVYADECQQVVRGSLLPGGRILLKGAGDSGEGGSVNWRVAIDQAGPYALTFGYTLRGRSRSMRLYVNGVLAKGELDFPAGDGLAATTEPFIVNQDAGDNHIRLVALGRLSSPFLTHVRVKTVFFLTRGGDIAPAPDPFGPGCGRIGDIVIAQVGYGNTYYGKVDPGCRRGTLDGWREVNGFYDNPLAVVNAQYVNAYDLGFGRNMHCLDNGRSSCYVENTPEPATEQNPNAADQFAVTVTMERMTFQGRNIVAFFVYDADGRRVNQVALDSEGAKAVPESCYACHFGYTDNLGNPVGGQYLPFDINLYQPWLGHPTLASQREDFRALNHLVWKDAVLWKNDPTDGLTDPLAALLQGWYDGAPTAGSAYDGGFVPDEWYVTTTPSGCADIPMSDECDRFFRERFLYKSVYAEYCRTCHITQGPSRDVPASRQGLHWGSAFNFSVDAHRVVCAPGEGTPLMPHAEITLAQFEVPWRSTDGVVASSKTRLCNEGPLPPPPTGETVEPHVEVMNARCAACHAPADLEAIPGTVAARIALPLSDALHMPPSSEPQLTAAEKTILLNWANNP